MKYLVAILLLTTVVLSSGCGPIVSGVQIVNANIALSAAETAGAKHAAVYEYTAARVYLQKAREEHSYSDFWASRIYADKALDYAVRARKTAAASADFVQPMVMPEAPPVLQETPAEPAPVIVPTM
ncbi:MAG: hypothetical protein A2289_01065 [Deltaproteobacteria bacterium RIFOXYA12_FULL_58_15]|nr:MAG: hypothetical protein A2289_01065 [Deltaproteobacteria bacterium RIFOXYA12_FULL_58_15]OGR14735.1 MAG: hypothetical protein A2341_05150 [Deltaproteobacteria bacterium RIFOXYB12_FULL_58_9]